MASNRKRKKTLWMSVKKMIKEVKSYNHKFTYKYGCGYFIFTFKNNEYNLHITFDKLPDMRFGIWYTTKYGDDKYYFFAEHDAYIDKFKSDELQFIINHSVLTTGFDAPKTDHIVLCRPTFSDILYEQIVGRGLRGPRFGGTETCTIIDFCDTCERFGDQQSYKRFETFWFQTSD